MHLLSSQFFSLLTEQQRRGKEVGVLGEEPGAAGSSPRTPFIYAQIHPRILLKNLK
jgi:hypothetical protein